MLDVLLSGQLAENRVMASEADLVEWWWEQQVRRSQRIAAEERVARQLAIQMADDLCTELSPDAVTGAEGPTDMLLKNRVLRRTNDGRLRFDHDLLADWSRVMHLRSLGDGAVAFMRTHAQNPPWLRAIRLLSQHLLERITDLERWRHVVSECTSAVKEHDEPSAENLQVLDAWLEGVAFCANSNQALASIKDDLFSSDGKLLRRLVRRLLHVGTFPDPVIQENWRQRDAKTAEAAATFFRLPQPALWVPVLQFLVNHSEQATEYLPVELAEIGVMWARWEDYLKRPWPVLADLILFNAEKELRHEVAGGYRSSRRARSLLGGNDSRISIYTAALHAGSQNPDRAAKLALKAAGRAPWDENDIGDKADIEWHGQWYGPPRHHPIPTRRYVTASLPPSWPDGPTRRTSHDFAHAWLESGAAPAVFQNRPEMACEATLGFLLAWPKRGNAQGGFDIGSKHQGFSSSGTHSLYPPFWAKGPFLMFLRHNWQPALDLITRLINFATDRYSDWWPYEPGVSVTEFATPYGAVSWKGTQQVYAWHRFHMNTVEVVTCALMALEKWLDECISAGKPIADPVRHLYHKGRSLAFAGVLISIGKRHPKLFLDELKPLLFVREFYMFDLSASRESGVSDFWGHDSRIINEWRHEWNLLPGRKTWLLNECCEWYLTKPEFGAVLEEVSAAWRKRAEEYPAGSEDRLILLRWASNFDRSVWKESLTPDGKKVWTQQRPSELRNLEMEKEQARRQTLMALPMRCQDALEKRQMLDDRQAQSIWSTLNNWTPFERDGTENDTDEFGAALLDHRHARAGLLALMLCLGRDWLRRHPKEYASAVDEVRKLLAKPPKVVAFTSEDFYDDGEGFLARCAIQCWSDEPENAEWRTIVGKFVAAYRYRTVQTLFDEAFHVRTALGAAFRELQALALSLAVVREMANRQHFQEPNPKLLDEWSQKWLPTFAKGAGPTWPDSWASIEATEDFPVDYDHSSGDPQRKRLGRRNYGLDVSVVLAAFAHLPPLTETADSTERAHWLKISKEMLGAFLRTLPPAAQDNQEEWDYNVWKPDEHIFDCVASRILESRREERTELWQPMLNLPPAAHHHITQFLGALLLEAMGTDPPRLAELLPVWREMVEYLFSLPQWAAAPSRGCLEVWQHLFLYGTPFTSVGDQIFIPFVEELRTLFERHVRTHLDDAHDQSAFAGFLTTKAGERLLVDALVWLSPSWSQANQWFWQTAVERSHFANLLGCAWREHFPTIRNNPEALNAFKTLTLKLAAQQVPIALEVQEQLGTNVQS